MSTVRLLVPILCLAIAAGASAARAAEPTAPAPAPASAPAAHHWHGHRGGAGSLRHVLRQLNLTPDQKTQIQAIFAQARPRTDALRASVRANRAALATTAPTDAKYPELVATEQSNAIARIERMSDLRTQVYAVLTPDQQAKIPAIVAAGQAAHAARLAAWRAAHPQA
jgi:Spy/CpxP family protein refolding chaperone